MAQWHLYFHAGEQLLIDPFLTEQGREGFRNVPERKIADIQRVFVETESFKKMKERLERLGHVIICGDQGEGKTSMALMLGAEYMKQGYELVLVEDVDKVQLSDFMEKSRDMCVIFDDLLKTVRSYIDVPRLRHFLYDLHVLLAQCEARSERSYFIFTAETNNLEYALSMLKNHQLFKSCSENILTNTTSLCYTHEEKEAIWMKHKRHYNCRTDVQENTVIAFKGTNVGFPLVCKLFSRYAGFQTCHERFFENPLVCIKEELQTIISLLDDKSAALILLLLCEGQLNISQLEAASDPGLEAHFKAVSSIVKTAARQGVVKALRTFCGTICTEGNTTAFSHLMIYDVCASVMFSIEPEFILKHCSIKFLLEHVHDEKSNITAVREHQLIISTSGAHEGTIVDRLTDSLVSGASSEYMLHPVWKTRKIADKLSQMTKTPATLSFEAKHNILHYACITGNKGILKRLVPQCGINRRGLNGWTPLMYAVVSGQVDCFDFLVKNKADVTLCDSSKNNLMHLACQHGPLHTVKHVNKVLKELPKNLYSKRYLNGQGLNDWTPVMCAVLSGEKDIFKFLIKLKVDLTLRNINNNTVFDIACQCGNSFSAECLVPFTDKK
ncbi:uncharacterized protein [Haliotis cracherodii]|uniref:uncharacterized protein n=1 Tax=Haliotis cracherodii TaxID=6455 RepID=UPI0039ECA628